MTHFIIDCDRPNNEENNKLGVLLLLLPGG
jgi:hypothetical protein